MPWARASALDRHIACPAASWLPRAERGTWRPGYLVTLSRGAQPPLPDLPVAPGGYQASWGTEMHLAKAGDPRAADPWVSWMAPHRERLYPGTLGIHEAPVAFDCRTGSVVRGPIVGGDEWKDSRGPSCVTGTCDWLAQLPTGEPWVDDLKTGWPTPDALSNQLKFYALCAVRLTGRKTGARTSATHWRRGWTEPERHWRKITREQLDDFEDQLREAWNAARRADAEPMTGPHCRYCPSLQVCPKHQGVTHV